MAPDDLNAVLGHIAQITVHVSRIFGVVLPFDLIPNLPITHIRHGPNSNDCLLLWMDLSDTTGHTINRFVTAVALLNFCIAWLASVVLPADTVHSWNGLENFWHIIDNWSPGHQLHRPSSSLAQVLRETMYTWNLHTGGNATLSISLEKLTIIMQSRLAHC
jgi:hypothetical protein